jgi:hypothetical protein
MNKARRMAKTARREDKQDIAEKRRGIHEEKIMERNRKIFLLRPVV